MASRQATIDKAGVARSLTKRNVNVKAIAKKLDVSEERVKEYLERNSHGTACKICGGYGINRQRSTGVITPICK